MEFNTTYKPEEVIHLCWNNTSNALDELKLVYEHTLHKKHRTELYVLFEHLATVATELEDIESTLKLYTGKESASAYFQSLTPN